MTIKQNQELQEMLEDMQNQSFYYKPTAFWEEASRVIIDEAITKDLKNFRAFKSSRSMFVPAYALPNYLSDPSLFDTLKHTLSNIISDPKTNIKLNYLINGETQAYSDYRVLCASNKNLAPYTDKISESNIGNPLEQFTFDNRHFSRSFLNYLLGLNFLKQHIDTTNIKKVMEIGGGFGTLGEILLGDERNDCFYINADIPPVSHFSSYYLKTLLGEENVASYSELKNLDILDIDTLSQNYKALNLCSWQVPNLRGKIDLFVNFISFQEMEPIIVKNYCHYIDKLEPKYILLRNIQEGKKKKSATHIYGVEEPIFGNDYDTFLPNYKLIQTDDSIFGLKMEDNFHSQLRLYIRKYE
ncbi:putative sugar O-methyltransferase [Sulfurimonas sp. SAG-AH-194-C20]|nr:putative sugar O-methyltransferase [Sulfurimonas sp. SAG-AH-194-C20]MDF1878201.1 putative sugar O-methyltransferase [Sulfurimonas sp. SAG-AH-194-C20]